MDTKLAETSWMVEDPKSKEMVVACGCGELVGRVDPVDGKDKCLIGNEMAG